MRGLKRENNALILATTIFFLVIIVIFGMFSFFFVQLLIQNIIPIAIGIVLIICVPTVVKGWYYQRTKGEAS